MPFVETSNATEQVQRYLFGELKDGEYSFNTHDYEQDCGHSY